eukprot:6521465-Prymnesium_polylepis.1
MHLRSLTLSEAIGALPHAEGISTHRPCNIFNRTVLTLTFGDSLSDHQVAVLASSMTIDGMAPTVTYSSMRDLRKIRCEACG